MGLGSILKGLVGAIPVVGPVLGAIGGAMGAGSQAQASNRGTKFEGQIDLEKLLTERDQNYWNNQMDVAKTGFDQNLATQQEGRASSGDAWRKLLSAQRTLSPSQMPSVSPYQAPQRQATGMERQGAEALSSEVMARLMGGNPVKPSILPTPTSRPVTNNDAGFRVDPNLLDAGKLEKILGIAAPALSFLGRSAPKVTS